MSIKKTFLTLTVAAFVVVVSYSNSYAFKEYPVGEPKEANRMEVAAVYFQAADMEPAGKSGLSAAESDIHLEADVTALMKNPYGFPFGSFVPYLKVEYKLENLDNGKTQEGTFMPMVASDGPHYGANVKMMGMGNYKLTYFIYSPEKQGLVLHADKTTGVDKTRFWKKPIVLEWEFTYTGKF